MSVNLFRRCFQISKRNFCAYVTNDQQPLATKHHEFLSLVKNQGNEEGNIRLLKNDKIFEIIIDNVKKKNAISGKMMNDLSEIVDRLSIYSTQTQSQGESEQPIILLIRSKPQVGESASVYCSGADLNLVRHVVNTPERGLLMCQFMTECLNKIRQLKYISVNVINGTAIGGGAELATVGDYRVMQANTKSNYIRFVHASIGASPGWGGGNRLINIVGRKQALRVMGTSCKVNPEEALNIGLVDKIYTSSLYGKNSNGYGYNDIDSIDIAEAHAINDIIAPFLAQPFAGSIHAIKTLVAAAEMETPEIARGVEADCFKSRWGGEDNKKSLAK